LLSALLGDTTDNGRLPKSDTASLNIMISELLHTIGEVHVLRDPTRGGVSGTLNEIAQDAGVDILLDEDALPIPEAVRAASEMLGLDPLYIANEGLVLVILPGPLQMTTSPGVAWSGAIRMPGGTIPIPLVLINNLSHLPRSTTFVSPATICTPARSAARFMDCTIR